MTRALLSIVLVVTLGAAAQASPSAASKQGVASTSRNYWLSDGLNRLVFWNPPLKVRGGKTLAR